MQEKFTQFPTVSTAQLSDIVLAVQGYESPTVLGTSVQETLQQIYNLFSTNLIQFNAGNPNGSVAGTIYQFCWDTVNLLLYVCVTSGSTSTAVWEKALSFTEGTGITISQSGNNITISSSGSGISWNNVDTSSVTMSSNNGYYTNNGGSLVTFTLPSTSSFGDIINVAGGSSGGWKIVYGTGQSIQVGSSRSTTSSGNIASTNQYNSIELVCVLANTNWQTRNAPQGNITVA